MNNTNSFKLSESYTSLYFYNRSNTRNDESHYKTLEILLETLKEHGFEAGLDKEVSERYSSISRDYFEGVRNKLAFKTHRYPTGFEFKFFYDTERGQYDFDRLDKMPYITKLEYLKYSKILVDKLIELGFENESKEEYKTPEDKIKARFVEAHWYPNIKDINFNLSDLDGTTTESYNNKDRDNKIIHNGEIKYFRTRNGYLLRGKVYHNINNMWWVIENDSDYTNEACFSLFDLTEEDKKQLKKIKKIKLYMNPKRKEYHDQEYRIGDNLFIINCRTGLFKAVTEYGCYQHYWDRSDYHKNNILRFNKGYILNKLTSDKDEIIDFEATMKDWKETILEWRRDTSLEEEQARNLWDALEEFDSGMSEEYICREFYDVCNDNDIDCPYESFEPSKKFTDDVIKFWDLFEQFRDLLRKELGVEK